MSTINYQKIYEDQVSEPVKTSLEMPRLYSDFPPQMKMFVEEVADAGAQLATQEVLDPEILRDTAELAADMAQQLYMFANMIRNHTHDVAPLDLDEDV
jgi:hypothetical protein